jgi:hypothetical protein
MVHGIMEYGRQKIALVTYYLFAGEHLGRTNGDLTAHQRARQPL